MINPNDFEAMINVWMYDVFVPIAMPQFKLELAYRSPRKKKLISVI